jgi:hypothetical protein
MKKKISINTQATMSFNFAVKQLTRPLRSMNQKSKDSCVLQTLQATSKIGNNLSPNILNDQSFTVTKIRIIRQREPNSFDSLYSSISKLQPLITFWYYSQRTFQ